MRAPRTVLLARNKLLPPEMGEARSRKLSVVVFTSAWTPQFALLVAIVLFVAKISSGWSVVLK